MTDQPTTDPAVWADGYLHGLADARQHTPESTGSDVTITLRNVFLCTCGVLSGGIRDPRLTCEVHHGQ